MENQEIHSVRSLDPGYKYGRSDKDNKNIWYCNFCEKKLSGGICRMKQHLAGGYRNATTCAKCPVYVRTEIKAYIEKKAESLAASRALPDIAIFNENNSDDVEELDHADQNGSSSNTKRGRQVKGPMDMFLKKRKVQRASSEKSVDVHSACDKALRDKACADIARFFYDAGIAFNAATYPSFHTMIESIGQYGPEMKGPSMHEIRVPLLNNEVQAVHKLMEDHKLEWAVKGCSILSDGWRDSVAQKDIVNFLVNSPKGSMFIKSMDVSEVVKDHKLLFRLLDDMVEEVGEENVIQVVTDNASNYVKAGELLMASRKHLYWTPWLLELLVLMIRPITQEEVKVQQLLPLHQEPTRERVK